MDSPPSAAGVWQRHWGSPAWPSTLTGAAIAAASALAESAPLGLWPRLVHSERPAAPILSVQSRHGSFSFVIVRHRNKTEAAGSSAVTIGRDSGALDAAMRLKQ